MSPDPSTSPLPPRRQRFGLDSVPPGAIPVGSIGRTQLNLSYGIFIASGIVLTVVLIAKGQPGNADLPRAATIGAAFWVAGWMAQAITYTTMTWWLGLSMPALTLGLVGVETSPRRWPAVKTLAVMLATIASLIVMAMLFRLIEGGGRMPILSFGAEKSDVGFWSMPSLGMSSPDSMWRSAAWLCCLQAVCQMFPLPGTLGRQTYGALTSICGYRLDLVVQVRLFRRCLIALSVMTLGLAIWLLSTESADRFPRWPILFGLSVLLWISSHRPDVRSILTGFQSASDGEFETSPARVSWIALWRTRRQSQRTRKRLKATMLQEHSEAVDAARLDEILHRLHHDGASSLSEDDRKILARVSEQLRKSRPTSDRQSGNS